MPPKKKRGGATQASKASTRIRRKTNLPNETETNVIISTALNDEEYFQANEVMKPVKKKGRPPKNRGGPGRKKKVEVIVIQDDTELAPEIATNSPEAETIREVFEVNEIPSNQIQEEQKLVEELVEELQEVTNEKEQDVKITQNEEKLEETVDRAQEIRQDIVEIQTGTDQEIYSKSEINEELEEIDKVEKEEEKEQNNSEKNDFFMDVQASLETPEDIVEQLTNLIVSPKNVEAVEMMEEIVEDAVQYITEEEVVMAENIVEETVSDSQINNEINPIQSETNECTQEIEEVVDYNSMPTTLLHSEISEAKEDLKFKVDPETQLLQDMLEFGTETPPKTIEEELLQMEAVATPTENQKVQLEPLTESCKAKRKSASRPRKNARKRSPKPKTKPPKKTPLNKSEEEVRRSSRIKSISVQKKPSKGHGLVKLSKPDPEIVETSNSSSLDTDKLQDSPRISTPSLESDNKPVKVKSRWRRSSELEINILTPATIVNETSGDCEKIAEVNELAEKRHLAIKPTTVDDEVEIKTRLKQFIHLKENLFLTDRMACKEAKKMTCDCFLTNEELERGEFGCGEDCLNRLLMIECGSLCPVGDRCTNKKFQKNQFAPVEVFRTDKKGLGLRAKVNIEFGKFILEYIGEVLDHDEFDRRADYYSQDKNRHYYFMSLRADAIIDATMKGNISRFINHSCEPNAETQKWTVNGELRIGFFSTRLIYAGEEITFDYQFQRYGKEAQKCYCEASSCRGWLGEEPDDDEEEDEDDEEEEEEEVEGGKVEEEKAEVMKIPKAKKEVKVRKEPKKRSPRKPRKDIFEDLDQLDDEIEMLVTTGLKNQAHTLKLSRLMVRAKEPAQRTKLLRILRRGELPCRRLFLDYHGLRLMHGYMTDAQDLSKIDAKFNSQRLEMLQTLATLPIPNKTMLQDSKVLPTVEKWANINESESEGSPLIETEGLTSDEKIDKKEHIIIDAKADNDKKVVEEIKNDSIQDTKEFVLETNTNDDNIDDDKSKAELVEEASTDKINTIEEDQVKIEETDTENGTTFETSMETETISEASENTILESVSNTDETALPLEENRVTSPIPSKEEIKSNELNYLEEITALALKLLEEWSNLKEVFKIPKKERIEQMKEHEREADRGYIAGIDEPSQEKKSENRYRVMKRYRGLDKLDNRKNCQKSDPDRYVVNFPKMNKFERRKMFALQVEQREEERRRKQREFWRQHEQQCMLLGTDPRLTAPYDANRNAPYFYNPQLNQWQNMAMYPGQVPNQVPNSYPAYLHPQNPMLPLPPLPYQEEIIKTEEDYTQVKFAGPIPPPVKLPAYWKVAKDKYNRPYYYHVRLRKSQWEPPPLSQPQATEEDESSETTSSSDTSSLSSDSSSEESDSEEDDLNDSMLMLQVHRQMEKQALGKLVKAEAKLSEAKTVAKVKKDEDLSPHDIEQKIEAMEQNNEDIGDKDVKRASKRKSGLVHEIIISPRTEEDKLLYREEAKRYKLNKEILKKEKEQILKLAKKHGKDKQRVIKLKAKDSDPNDIARKIKETFRSNMASVVVSVLNAYRKPDCKEGRIGSTEDFKHLARKLTHFVMLKEMKHILKIDDLICTESVKSKAKEYIRKYMSKFGENYQKRSDEPDY